MITVDVPGFKNLQLKHLVLDFNGTLAVDGIIEDGVKATLNKLSEDLDIYVVTADTFGKAKNALQGVNCRLTILGQGQQDQAKLSFTQSLGFSSTACIGNGRNDRLMIREAALGIAVILDEGVSGQCIMAANIVCKDIFSALDLLKSPLRMTATLRS